ncbi:MAG TPA: Rrf2 family transcriptional regulator [Phycisphaerae bacterium]|nr:Rrf2 family transcriptional regulator [Phycisphaerae bacterium]HOJ72400.1 Rrf2 family transcriptional regulator [Phycisphaerae bacterium]HOM49938.1 Rrf2 family transcriptional regulator [Phycisphaerae bacterium]HON66970.1 Rrf2 family transcriptional regulator [Phycisphaerae bacterium]HOQ87412.1 Rrf2 family transcriptional regulator [Phycisphaerae bacterium]
MISRTAEYALRAIVYLADQEGKALTTQQIAEATRVPAGYLSKVLQALGRAGLVVSQRGLHGGFTLGSEPDQISVLTVINAVDPIQRIRRCPLGVQSHGEKLCPLHHRLDSAMEMVEQAFGETTVAELLNDPSQLRPLCDCRKE